MRSKKTKDLTLFAFFLAVDCGSGDFFGGGDVLVVVGVPVVVFFVPVPGFLFAYV